MKRINMHFSEQQIKKIKDLMNKSGLTFAELIRRIIDKYFDESGMEPPK